MRVYNRLILTLAIVFSCITVALACLGQKDLTVYFIADAIAYFVITLLFVNFSGRTRSFLNAMSGVIFAGLLVIVAVKVVDILK